MLRDFKDLREKRSAWEVPLVIQETDADASVRLDHHHLPDEVPCRLIDARGNSENADFDLAHQRRNAVIVERELYQNR